MNIYATHQLNLAYSSAYRAKYGNSLTPPYMRSSSSYYSSSHHHRSPAHEPAPKKQPKIPSVIDFVPCELPAIDESSLFINNLRATQTPRWMYVTHFNFAGMFEKYQGHHNTCIVHSSEVETLFKFHVNIHSGLMIGAWDETSNIIITSQTEYDDSFAHYLLNNTNNKSCLMLSPKILSDDFCENVLSKIYSQFSIIVVMGTEEQSLDAERKAKSHQKKCVIF